MSCRATCDGAHAPHRQNIGQKGPAALSNRSHISRWCLVAPAAILLATACGDRTEEAPTPDPFISTDNPRDELTEVDYGDLDPSQVSLNTPWGRNIVSKDATPDRDPATLMDVSTQSSDGYDRVIFTFESHIPGFRRPPRLPPTSRWSSPAPVQIGTSVPS